jgi:hypothetical protein
VPDTAPALEPAVEDDQAGVAAQLELHVPRGLEIGRKVAEIRHRHRLAPIAPVPIPVIIDAHLQLQPWRLRRARLV